MIPQMDKCGAPLFLTLTYAEKILINTIFSAFYVDWVKTALKSLPITFDSLWECGKNVLSRNRMLVSIMPE
jgi:hypothetical protein